MHRVVLGSGDHLQIMWIIPLQSSNERDPHSTGEVGIFAIRLLAASPARIPEDVEVRRQVSQSGDTTGRVSGRRLRDRVVAQSFMIFGASFRRNRARDTVNETCIPGCAEPDRFWKDRGPAACHAVQRLVPPVIDRYPEAWNRGRAVLHLL